MKKYDLPFEISGLSTLASFAIPGENWLKYKTLITQKMLKKSFLAANSVYVCTEHTSAIIGEYFENLDSVFDTISECEDGGIIDNFLEGPVCQTGFGRLN